VRARHHHVLAAKNQVQFLRVLQFIAAEIAVIVVCGKAANLQFIDLRIILAPGFAQAKYGA
jgi:hypothetical protein